MADPFKEAIADAENLLALARRYVAKRAPYLGPTLYGLVPVWVPDFGTMGVTEDLILYCDPIWAITDPEVKEYKCAGGCLCHECMHPALRHLPRIRALVGPSPTALAKKLANYSADFTINPPLRDADWILPSWACYPDNHGFPVGLTMEQYYELFMRNPDKGESMPQQVCSGQCGGVAGNAVSRDLEDRISQEEGGRPEIEQKRIQKSTAHQMKEHAKRHGWGSVPGAREEEVTFEPKRSTIDWRKHLLYAFRRSTGRVMPGGNDYSLFRPSQRSALLGVIRPSLVEQLPVIAFIRDTSASVDDKMLNSANNEIIHIMRQLGLDEVWLLDADVKVQRQPTRVRVRDIPNLPAKGRGGTSFQYALDAVAKMKPRPDVFVYLTDGYAPEPTQPRGMDGIWCLIPPCTVPAKWGTVVECKE